ncbi:elongation factor P maturation arginine rhamnosyltransferase EarP [Comamonas odontotermitis]|uniref:elongation factor P maturation arginine rhamnosyltransferase EarP n=1 Tax=Comamonas odontotermitis TaxID=379895 RepID=UPI001CC5DFDE|nr:elongation factor P maturation arginine rhamnosyltransferase EarP [Comamonas odontotermitis]UBB16107.1 elongation factor P maturation arginine rhamnosyltransferase EarP [Comamonas odontotermitis]
MHEARPAHRPVWDIFCQVIDNFGDIGVCWRLAADLAQRGCQVRLWVDDASALAWMAPQGAPHVQVWPWPEAAPPDGPGDVVIEAFGCEIPPSFQQAIAGKAQDNPRSPVWINLEYLSAQDYVERCHRLPSRLMSGPAAGLTRWFFYPGFTDRTGGLLREAALAERQAAFDRPAWRARHGLQDSDLVFSLFCYEPAAFAQVFAASGPGVQWLVTPGRATALVQSTPQAAGAAHVHYLPTGTQLQFDDMLWACDLNFVRGEDSLVRAIWAGKPFIWQIYPQDDNAHHAKLAAFLDWLEAPASLREAHALWNGTAPADAPLPWPTPSPALLALWATCVQAARHRLQAQPSLTEQLMAFVGEKG